MADSGAETKKEDPKPSDELTSDEKDRISKWFAKKGQKAECPICRTSNWAVLDHFVTPVIVGGPSLVCA